MADVKALFPIGKTQWAKWRNDQREAFNETRAAGVPFADAVAYANGVEAPKKKNFFDVVEDVVETVTDVAAVVSPVVAVAKTATRARTKKAK